VLHEIRPLTREYDFIRSMAPGLPRRLQIVRNAAAAPGVPAYRFPSHLLEQAGIEGAMVDLDRPDAAIDPAVPARFFQGVFCHAYSLSEVTGLPRQQLMPGAVGPALQRKILQALSTFHPSGLQVPAGPRPECRALMELGTPLGRPRVIDATTQDPPFALFGKKSIELQFYRLSTAKLRQAGYAVLPSADARQ
jgi:hypothetical protein